jgi:hypothetical protein
MNNKTPVERMLWGLISEYKPDASTVISLLKKGETECGATVCVMTPNTRWGTIQKDEIIAQLEARNEYPHTHCVCHASYRTTWGSGAVVKNAILLDLTFRF